MNMKTEFSTCVVEDWGLINYQQAYARQKEEAERVIAGAPARLIFCEHPAVLTLGRMTKRENLLWPKELIESKDVSIVPIDRGGDVTLHAPGQLVIYSIMNLSVVERNLKRYLEQLQEVVIDLLKEFDILAEGLNGQRGVWAGKDKIASIGVGVRKWVSYHGIGLNVNTDLELFRMIRPCGLDVAMTSMKKLKGQPVDINLVKEKAVRLFCNQFNLKQIT